ncbi:MAG: V-type ATPase subunit [Eubacterium sp.]
MSLDLFFFSYIWNHQDLFVPKGEEKYFVDSIGSQADLLNLMWIFRCKNYYSVSESQIYSFLIPIYYNLDRNTIRLLLKPQTMMNFSNCLIHVITVVFTVSIM